MRLTRIALLPVLALFPLQALAQDTREAELEVANQGLNATYRALMQRLGPTDQAALKKAQRAWLVFRDADCEFGWGDRRDCLIERTHEREEQFKTSIYFDAQGKEIILH